MHCFQTFKLNTVITMFSDAHDSLWWWAVADWTISSVSWLPPGTGRQGWSRPEEEWLQESLRSCTHRGCMCCSTPPWRRSLQSWQSTGQRRSHRSPRCTSALWSAHCSLRKPSQSSINACAEVGWFGIEGR